MNSPAKGIPSDASIATAMARVQSREGVVGPALPEFKRFLEPLCEGRKSEQIDSLHLRDLYLSCAALQGCPTAIEIVHKSLRTELSRVWTKAEYDCASEVQQAVLVSLLVSNEGCQPKLSQYQGRASLRSWLRVIVVREYQRTVKGYKKESLGGEDMQVLPGRLLPMDTAMDTNRYVQAFKSVFQECFASLSIHDRTILRQHYRDRITIGKMSQLRNVHRGTMARELAQVRQRLEQSVSSSMWRALEVDSDAAAMLHAQVASQLEISLSRLFREIPGDDQ